MTSRREFIRQGATAASSITVAGALASDSSTASALPVENVPIASSRAALAATIQNTPNSRYLAEKGRQGLFFWTAGDLSSEVTNDVSQAIYVAPSHATNGSQGAWVRQFDGNVEASWFGLSAGGSVANTGALNAALSWMKRSGGGTLTLPKGSISVGDLGNLAQSNLTIRGHGMQQTILRATHAGVAFYADAFPNLDSKQPFVDQFNLEDLTLEGNAQSSDILLLQGISRSHFTRVNLREAGRKSGKALHLQCVVTSLFVECYVSTNFNAMSNRPKWGLYADEGRRNRVSTGHTSNCSFINCEFSGLDIGMELARADQTSMIGGASQGCVSYGLIVRSPSRFNSFQNTAFENMDSKADMIDQGIMSSFEGCYFSERAEFSGSQCRLRNCYGERFEIKKIAEYTDIANVRFNHWNTGAGGFFNQSDTTQWRALYDVDARRYID